MKLRIQHGSGLYSACVVLAGCLWGTTGLFIRTLNEMGLTSMHINVLRSGITAVCMLLITLCIDFRLLRVRLRDLWCFFGTGVCSVLFFNFCYFHTIQVSSMAVAATLLYTSPVFVMLLSLFLFKEKITLRKAASLLLAVVGCVLVSGILSEGHALQGTDFLLGLGAGLGYALYSVFARYALLRGYHSLTITTYTFLFSAMGGLLFLDFPALGTVWNENGFSMLWRLLLYAVVTTVLSYLLYTVGLTKVENSKAAVMAAVEPAVAALLGLLVLHEVPTPMAAVGILLVLAAVVLLNWPGREKSPAK